MSHNVSVYLMFRSYFSIFYCWGEIWANDYKERARYTVLNDPSEKRFEYLSESATRL